MLTLVFDTETTGLPRCSAASLSVQPRLIEFAGILIGDDGEHVEEFETLIDPQQPLPEIITEITRLTDDDLRGKPHFRDVAPQITAMIEKASLAVAHNLTFDKDVIEMEFARCHIPLPRWPMLLCTAEETQHWKGHRLRLGDLYHMLFKETFSDAHRAMADTRALARVFVALRKAGHII
jgi:DNA polymerase III epsilon subunit-like protein